MFSKVMGFACTIIGGILLGIGLNNSFIMPLGWWIVTLLFLCIGSMGIFSEGKRRE